MSDEVTRRATAPPWLGEAIIEIGKEYVAKRKDQSVKTERYTATEQPHGFVNREP